MNILFRMWYSSNRYSANWHKNQGKSCCDGTFCGKSIFLVIKRQHQVDIIIFVYPSLSRLFFTPFQRPFKFNYDTLRLFHFTPLVRMRRMPVCWLKRRCERETTIKRDRTYNQTCLQIFCFEPIANACSKGTTQVNVLIHVSRAAQVLLSATVLNVFFCRANVCGL